MKFEFHTINVWDSSEILTLDESINFPSSSITGAKPQVTEELIEDFKCTILI